MDNIDKIIEAMEICTQPGGHFKHTCRECPYHDSQVQLICKELTRDMLKVIKALKEPKELTIDEWEEWKKAKNHDPICKIWEHDTTPIWILKASEVHEPALLMGKCKLFWNKPTSEQCKNIKWNKENDGGSNE